MEKQSYRALRGDIDTPGKLAVWTFLWLFREGRNEWPAMGAISRVICLPEIWRAAGYTDLTIEKHRAKLEKEWVEEVGQWLQIEKIWPLVWRVEVAPVDQRGTVGWIKLWEDELDKLLAMQKEDVAVWYEIRKRLYISKTNIPSIQTSKRKIAGKIKSSDKRVNEAMERLVSEGLFDYYEGNWSLKDRG